MTIKHSLRLSLIAVLLSACAGTAPTPTPTPVSSPTAIIPTVTPTAQPSPTPIIYAPPAEKFLPAAGDFQSFYAIESNILSDNLSNQVNLPVPKENAGVVSFRNQGSQSASQPQDGVYYRFTYWVIVAPDEMNARLFYAMSKSPEYAKQAFLVIMPAAIYQNMGEISTLPASSTICDEINIFNVISDPYAIYRTGTLPTQNPNAAQIPGGLKPEDVIKLPPDLYIYSGCRIKNVLVLFWGHTPNNFDGNNKAIPGNVIAGQVNNFFEIVKRKLK